MTSKNKTIQFPGGRLDVIPMSLIEVGDRWRKEVGDIKSLGESIMSKGLINPITVFDANEEGKYLLIAGGRRYQACKALEWETIPVRIFEKEPTDLELRTLELAENMDRQNFSWQEENSLIRKIHELMQEIHGTPTKAAGKDGWTVEDTAKMMGYSRAAISDAVKLDKTMEAISSIVDPTRFKNRNDAVKFISQAEEAEVRRELARRQQKKSGGTSIIDLLASQYRIGNFWEEGPKLTDSKYDLAIIDPPYAINLHEVKGTGTQTYTEIPQERYILDLRKTLDITFQKLKPDTYAILWYAISPWHGITVATAQAAGFSTSGIPLFWCKPTGQTLSPNQNLANAVETALILKKGSPVLSKPGRTNVFSFIPVAPARKFHPTQKPLDLCTEVIETFSFEAANVLVPFGGSGVDLLACAQRKRTGVCFDLEESHKGGFLQWANEIFAGV